MPSMRRAESTICHRRERGWRAAWAAASAALSAYPRRMAGAVAPAPAGCVPTGCTPTDCAPADWAMPGCRKPAGCEPEDCASGAWAPATGAPEGCFITVAPAPCPGICSADRSMGIPWRCCSSSAAKSGTSMAGVMPAAGAVTDEAFSARCCSRTRWKSSVLSGMPAAMSGRVPVGRDACPEVLVATGSATVCGCTGVSLAAAARLPFWLPAARTLSATGAGDPTGSATISSLAAASVTLLAAAAR